MLADLFAIIFRKYRFLIYLSNAIAFLLILSGYLFECSIIIFLTIENLKHLLTNQIR